MIIFVPKMIPLGITGLSQEILSWFSFISVTLTFVGGLDTAMKNSYD